MATDLSARSDRALQRAIAIAAMQGAELEIVNVVDATLPQAIVDRHEETAKSAIEAQVWALPTAKGLRPVTRIIRGAGFLDIVRRCEDFHADLLVIGIHRHSTRLMFRGTTAERILRMGRTPVLVVRDPVVYAYMRVLVGSDLSPHSRAALQFAMRLAPEAEFEIVHALHVPYRHFLDEGTRTQFARDEEAKFKELIQRDIESLMSESPQRPAPLFRLTAQTGLPLEVLNARVKEFRPDLIAVGTHSRSGIAGAVLGSVTEELLAQPPTDVLAVKAW
jgi:nucleotide-binding universal stress UspA family protein